MRTEEKLPDKHYFEAIVMELFINSVINRVKKQI